MKLYWNMPMGLKTHYHQELNLYKIEFAQQHLPQAWQRLERAHVLAQVWPREHSYVHWLMLRFGFFIKSPREIIGQIPRLLVGALVIRRAHPRGQYWRREPASFESDEDFQ